MSPSSRINRVLDMIVSICLICVSAALIAVAIHYLREPKPTTNAQSGQSYQTLKKGQTLDLQSIRQEIPKGNLLLVALQTGCRFCRESVPLYKALLSHSEAMDATVIFVFSEPLPDAAAYLRDHGLGGAKYSQAEFRAIHVQGTPTLILVDQQNRVKNYWIGKLEDGGIADLGRSLRIPNW